LGLALDEPEDSDETAVHQGVTYMMSADVHQFLPAHAQVAIGVRPYGGGFSVHIVGQRAC